MRPPAPLFHLLPTAASRAYVPDTPTATLLDVGEADAVLAQEPKGHVILVEAGRKGAAPAVSDALAAEGITRLDDVVATLEDADHIRCMVRILSYLTVGGYLNNGVENPDPGQTTLFLRTELASHAITSKAVTAGATLALDPPDVTVTVGTGYGTRYGRFPASLRSFRWLDRAMCTHPRRHRHGHGAIQPLESSLETVLMRRRRFGCIPSVLRSAQGNGNGKL